MKDFRKNCIVDLGKRLKQLREERNLSLNMFAYENDMTLSTVSRIENGLVIPKFSTLMMYSIALEMSLEEILEGIELTEEVDEINPLEA